MKFFYFIEFVQDIDDSLEIGDVGLRRFYGP